MSDFTPGPWIAKKADVLDGKPRYQTAGAIMVYADDDCDIHPIADCSANHTCRDDEEAQANARLIAAAPALFEAAAAYERAYMETQTNPTPAQEAAVMALVQTVLAKVRAP